MADVFISYARSNEAQARAIGEALGALGYGVWRDDELPAHRDYSDVIEERLRAAKAVVVAWSAEAARSQWVRAEADVAREAGVLVQLTLDGAPLPLPFNRIQCADLAGWAGDAAHPGWRKVAASVAELVGAPAAAPAAQPAVRGEPLLAVLPFDNLSGDPEMAYFSDGVSEEILDTVARGADLKVIGRSSSFQFRGAEKAAGRVAAALKASHVLDGSVRRAGTRVRISAQLVDCASETALWSDRFDRELADVFALQDEIAEAVASALKVALAPARRPAAIRPQTYETYLRALAAAAGWFAQGSLFWADESIIAALEAVTADAPTFAAAWENLAYFRVASSRRDVSAPGFAAARAAAVEAAETALRLDPGRARAWLALALLEPWGEHAARGERLDRALAANGSDILVLRWRMRDLGMVGRLQASLQAAQQNQTLDPLDRMYRADLVHALGYLGRYDEALAICDAMEDEPAGLPLGNALYFAAAVHDWGRFDRYWALAPAGQALMTRGDAEFRRHLLNLRNDDRAGMAAALEAYRAGLRDTGTIPLNALTEMVQYGLRDAAYELAERASFAHLFRPDGDLPAGAYTPAIIFAPSRDGGLSADPRFVRLAAKLGLVDYWLATDRWPDCAEAAPYDFRAEARRLTAGARA